MLDGATPGGCAFAETADRPALQARQIWDRAFDPSVLTAEASPAPATVVDRFDISKVAATVSIAITQDGCERVALSDAYRRIRVDIVRGSVLDGPVSLRYRLGDGWGLDAQLLTLRRLQVLRRTGRFTRTLFPPEKMAPRWLAALRACDAIAAGASQRELADLLFGPLAAHATWRGESDFLRLRVQRLVRIGRRMTESAYLSLLR
jgi:hypothetical protein